MRKDSLELVIVAPSETKIPTKDEIVEAVVKLVRMLNSENLEVCHE